MGAGILAVPFTTQDSGFIPSTASLIGTYVFSVVTGLLLAEANINLMCELGKVGAQLNKRRQLCAHSCVNSSALCTASAIVSWKTHWCVYFEQGGVSITSISRTTLGTAGEKATTLIYLALHYALLVACKASPLPSVRQIAGS